MTPAEKPNAYDENFVGKLSHYVGNATLKIKYRTSNDIGKAIDEA